MCARKEHSLGRAIVDTRPKDVGENLQGHRSSAFFLRTDILDESGGTREAPTSTILADEERGK